MGFFANSESGLDRIRNEVRNEEKNAKRTAKARNKKIPAGQPGNRSASQISQEVMKRSGSLRILRGK